MVKLLEDMPWIMSMAMEVNEMSTSTDYSQVNLWFLDALSMAMEVDKMGS